MTAGFILINKPSGPTSHDVVNFVRRITGEKRVGHAGTLDPFASGLLIVGVGREATKHLGTFLKLDKRYSALLNLGAVSDTYDRTGKITNFTLQEVGSRDAVDSLACPLGVRPSEDTAPEGYPTSPNPSQNQIKNTFDQFRGPLQQIPPMYSAKKVNGKKLYELARKGKEIERKPVPITIFELSLVHYAWPTLELDIHCSSGTYIRSLAHDIGQTLGCGAYVEELQRTAVGKWQLADACTLEELRPETWTIKIVSTLDNNDQIE